MDVRVLSVQRERSGIAQYIAGLFSGYREDAAGVRLVPLSYSREGTSDLGVPSVVIASKGRVPWLTVLLPWALRHEPYQLFHGPAFAVPPRLSLPSVVTVHDLTYLRMPETVMEDTARYLSRVVPQALKGARRVIVPSTEVKEDLIHYYPRLVAESRIRVIPEGADRMPRVSGARPLNDPYILHLGTVEPRKNLPDLIAAWDVLRRDYQYCQRLVLVGHSGWKTEAFLKQLGEREDIVVTGYLPDGQLAQYLAHADLVISSSRYEGFGLPVVEALYQGARVMSTPTGVARDLQHPALVVTEGFSLEALGRGLEKGLQLGAPTESFNDKITTWVDTFRHHAALYHEAAQ